jgi:hypothetical protein
MNGEKVVRVKCHFSRGGFPSERVFHIKAPGGGSLTGTAPVEYCFAKDGTPLRQEIPRGEQVDGYITGLLLGPAGSGKAVRVYLPDGEIYEIDNSQIIKNSEGAHVPVK